MLASICLAHPITALQYGTTSNHMGFNNDEAFVLDPESAQLQHFRKFGPTVSPPIDKPPPNDWSLLRLLWAEKVLPGDCSRSEPYDEYERRFQHLPLPQGGNKREARGGSEDEYFRSAEFSSAVFNNLQSIAHAYKLTTPEYYLIHSSLLSNIPRRFQWLAVLIWLAIPMVSANVGTMEWAFGILATIPSTYVVANQPGPPIVDHRAEKVVWKLARGW